MEIDHSSLYETTKELKEAHAATLQRKQRVLLTRLQWRIQRGGGGGSAPPPLALAISPQAPISHIQPIHLPSLFAYKDGKCHV